MKDIKLYWINRKTKDPKWFKATTVHTAYLERKLKDIFYDDKPVLWTSKWQDKVRIYYRNLWELEPILFNSLTWVIRKDLIEEFEKKLWKKIYKEIEFLPVEIVPKWFIVEWKEPKDWPVLKDYYLAHVLKRVEPKELTIKDCEELKRYDFIWMPDWTDIMFSERVKEIFEEKIKEGELKIWYIQEQDVCKWARLKETEEWRNKLKKEEEERRKIQEEKEKIEEALKSMWVKLWDIKVIRKDKE